MQPGVDDGFAVDPRRLREAAGAVQARGADVAEAAASVRAASAAAAVASGGPRLSAALGDFERELTERAGVCADALRSAGTALAQTADDVERSDRFPHGTPGPAPGGPIREALG